MALGPYQKPLLGARIDDSHPLAKGIVSCWLFNETSGNRAHDVCRKRNHGTLTNMSPQTLTSGFSSAGIEFDGSDDYVVIGKPEIYNEITVVALFKTPNPTTNQEIITFQNEGITLRSYHSTPHGPAFYVTTAVATSAAALPANEWTHLVGTYKPGFESIYVNGTLRGSNAAYTGTITNSALKNYIGIHSGLAANKFSGTMAHIMLYNRALSANEVADLCADPYCMFKKQGIPAEIELSGSGVTHSCAGASISSSIAAGVLALAIGLSGAAAGASTCAGAMGATRQIDGVSESLSTASANVSVLHALQSYSAASPPIVDIGAFEYQGSAIPCVSAATGDLSVGATQECAGEIAGASAGAGTLDLTLSAEGAAAGTSSASGTSVLSIGLDGSGAGSSAASGELRASLSLLGAAQGASTAGADIAASLPIVASSASASESVGDLAVLHSLEGSAASASTASGLAGIVIPLSTGIPDIGAYEFPFAYSTATGALDVHTAVQECVGSAAASSAATASIDLTLVLSGASASTSAASAGAALTAVLSGASASSSVASATSVTLVGLSASAASSSAASATGMYGGISLAGVSSPALSATADLGYAMALLYGSSASVSTATAKLSFAPQPSSYRGRVKSYPRPTQRFNPPRPKWSR
jgi:hypothetical protein